VEILWDAAIDSAFRRAVWLKGFEDGQIRIESDRTEFAPLRRNAISVFDNLVERASRERADSGASPKRSHKMGYGVFARELTWSPAHPFERWSWQPAFYPSAGDQVSNESLILAQNQRWRRA
jgi:hypothetical protein